MNPPETHMKPEYDFSKVKQGNDDGNDDALVT